MAAAKSVLVICMRRIGDVLLATPVAGSIKSAWPDAAIDMLVFEENWSGSQTYCESFTGPPHAPAQRSPI